MTIIMINNVKFCLLVKRIKTHIYNGDTKGYTFDRDFHTHTHTRTHDKRISGCTIWKKKNDKKYSAIFELFFLGKKHNWQIRRNSTNNQKKHFFSSQTVHFLFYLTLIISLSRKHTNTWKNSILFINTHTHTSNHIQAHTFSTHTKVHALTFEWHKYKFITPQKKN